MQSFKKLLLNNQAWAKETTQNKPDFFKDLAKEQKPAFLWIGCSDSRVPAEEITGVSPGELFVHRNVANLVVRADLNLMSVIQYAVDTLQVQHIIVCGHTGCGGVKASLSDQRFGLLDHWIAPLKELIQTEKAQLDSVAQEKRLDRLVELNVRAQVDAISKITVVQENWKARKAPSIHGWVYQIENGLIKPVKMLSATGEVDPLYNVT